MTSSWSGPAGAEARFRMLGPLEVVLSDGQTRPIPRRGERALLSVLLLFAGQPCSQDLLARALWAGRLPEHPDVALRVSVSRLRKSLGPADCLTRVRGSYCADLQPDSTDLDRFRMLHDQAARRAKDGNLRGAASALKSALAYWRDPPLADLPGSPYIDAEAACLLEERRRAELELTELQLGLGEHERIVPDLKARVIVDPGSEWAWRQLIRALHLCGRRGEALAAFGEAEKILADGYGTRHAEGLQATFRMVLDSEAPARASRPSGLATGIYQTGRDLASTPPTRPSPPAAARARRHMDGREISRRKPGPSEPR